MASPRSDATAVLEIDPLMENLEAAADEPASPTTADRGPRPSVVALLVVGLVGPLLLRVGQVGVFELKQEPRAARSVQQGTVLPPNSGFVACTNASSHANCVLPLLQLGDVGGTARRRLYAEEIFQVDWSQHTTLADVVHLGKLQRACMAFKESVIPWAFGLSSEPSAGLVDRTTDQAVIDALRQCPSLDVYIPSGLRGEGYCEDAAAYAKYAQARLLPSWVFDEHFFDATVNRTVSYFELCPVTPLLVLNHFWDGLREDPAWPATKPLFLMPNIEMFELQARHYWQADVVLCKTVICADYVAKWFAQEGNPRLTQVLYTRHTSSDVATTALLTAQDALAWGDWSEPHTSRRNFTHPKFIHTAGSSTQKGTSRVLECWLSRPDLPRADVYMSRALYDRLFRERYDAFIASPRNTNLHLHLGTLDASAFSATMADATFFLCTSRMEGYGHYINQARAAGGLVLTPDVPPMNELVTASSGVLINASRMTLAQHFLGGASTHRLGLRNVTGFVSRFSGGDLCAAVDSVVRALNTTQRQQMAHRARQQYLYDTAFFAWKMRVLREALRPAGRAGPPH